MHVCVYMCVRASTWKSYVGWAMLYEAPEVAYSESRVLGPEMKPRRLERAVQGDFGWAPPICPGLAGVIFPDRGWQVRS